MHAAHEQLYLSRPHICTKSDTGHLRFQTLSGQISMYEIALNMECDGPIDRAEALSTCLDRIDDLMAELCALPTRTLPFLPVTFWLGILHAVALLANLSFHQAKGWDLDFVRRRVSFTAFIDRLTYKLGGIVSLLNDNDGPSNPVAARFQTYSDKMSLCKRWYEAKINAESSETRIGGEVGPSEGRPSSSATVIPNMTAFDMSFDAFDDSMWQDLILDWGATGQD